MNFLIKLLANKNFENVSPDSPDFFSIQRKVLRKNKIIRDVFTEFHQYFLKLEKQYSDGFGKRIELGTGSFSIKLLDSKILSSDVVKNKYIDLKLDAEKMKLKNNSVKSFFLQNVFHHIANPTLFFKECERVLSKGGIVIILEPYHNFISKILYSRISNNEYFDKNEIKWSLKKKSRMSFANQAQSYKIFVRDKKKFKKLYPNLNIVHISLAHNSFRYLFSGGIYFKQLFPNFFFTYLKKLEKILKPFHKYFAIHWIVVLKKNNNL